MSTGPRNQDNLSSCAECKSYEKYHTTSGKDSVWKEIKRNKHSTCTIQPKKMLNCARQQNSDIPLSKNRFEPISNYQSQDHSHSCVQTKFKSTQRSRNNAQNKHSIVLLGDSQVRGCSEKLSDILGSSCNITGITKPNTNTTLLA